MIQALGGVALSSSVRCPPIGPLQKPYGSSAPRAGYAYPHNTQVTAPRDSHLLRALSDPPSQTHSIIGTLCTIGGTILDGWPGTLSSGFDALRDRDRTLDLILHVEALAQHVVQALNEIY